MVFISYSRADINNVRPIVERLRRNGIDCWLDESNIPVGEAFVVQLGEALARADAFILVDTPASRASYWVKRERITAFRLRDERRAFIVARMFSPELADSGEPWNVSVPLTPAGEEGLLNILRNQMPQSASEKPKQLSSGAGREGDFGQPQNWSGRQEELERLDNWWVGSKAGAWVRGLGGSGKSGLIQTWVTALEYLGYESAQAVGIFFISGREGISSPPSDSSVKDFLRRATRFQRTLIVLDGFDEVTDSVFAEQLLSEALAHGARVLVSSRSAVPEPLLDSFTAIDLDAMSQRDAVAFLAQMGVVGEDALAIAQELRNHPLAVLVFSRYVAESNLKPGDALELIRKQNSQSGVSGANDTESLSKTIGVTLERAIASLSRVAQKLLSSLCRSDAPDLTWPECAPSAIAVSDALAGVKELSTKGLVRVDRFDAPTQLAIHDLVKNYVRSRGEVEASESNDP